MSTLHPDLVAAAAAAEIVSPSAYIIRGERREIPDPAQLLPSMEQETYARLYTRADGRVATPTDFTAQREHVAALSAANGGRGTWEPGWRIEEIDGDGRIGVRRDAVTFWTSPDGVRTHGGALHPGDFCRVWVGKEMRHLVPGFYFAYGNGDPGERDVQERLLRFFWHLVPGAAVAYVATATSTLNALDIPFRTKVLSDPGAYVRADAGVLYVERRYCARAMEAVRSIHRTLESRLRPDTPMFTHRVAPGLGLAEDPQNGLSFGQSRCRIVVQGLWDAYERREGRETAIASAFRGHGIDPMRPWLEAGSEEIL